VGKLIFPVTFWVHSYLFVPRFRKQHRILLSINGLDIESEKDGEIEVYKERKRGKELWGAWGGTG
jgi:hypothetical protein